MLDKYLEELRKEASQPTLDNLPISTLAELAGVKLAARDMPPFLKQDRPEKVKDVYRALKREHPEMPAGTKARIASHVGKKKTAGLSPELIHKLKTIGISSVPAATGAATGALAAGEDKRLKGALLGSILGLIGGSGAINLADPTSSLGKLTALVGLGGAVGGGIGGYAIRPDGKKKTAWDTTLQKLAQEPTHEDLQRQLMEADPERMGRQYGMAGAAGGALAGGLAAIPAFAKLRGAGKLLGLAAPTIGGLVGRHFGAQAGEREASHESALQHALYSTGLREGAMMGAQAAMQQMYGDRSDYGDEGMDVHASVRSRRPFDKTGSAAAAATAGGKSFAQLGKDSLMWFLHRPELTAGVIGGVGGAGIGAATSDDKKHTARRAIVGGLTGATLGGLGGAFFRQLGVGERLSRVEGYRVGLAEGITSGQAAGMAEGVQTGRLKGTLDTINKIKNTKLPLIPKARVERLSNELIKGLSELQEISDPELTHKGLDELLKKVTSLKT